MQKILNITLLTIFLSLVALFIYKTIKTPEVTRATITEKSETEHKNSDAKQIISRTVLEKEMHDYIIDHPEVLVESIENMQKKKMLESDKQVTDYLSQNKALIEEDGVPPVLGNKDGDVTIVVFYDYNCSFCKKANLITNEIMKSDPNVKVVLRPIPILGGTSMYVSKIALAVYKISEEKFWNIHNNIMDMEQITEESVKALLADNNIDYSIVENELNSLSVKQLITKNFDFAKNLGIKGAPSYLVNGVFIPGMVDFKKFTTIISEIRQIAAQTKNDMDKSGQEKMPEQKE